VLVVLFGSLLLYIQSNQSQVIQDEIAELNNTYKGEIRVGDSELSLFGNFPYISIKVYDIQVFETKGKDALELINVEDIYVGFNFWEVVSGNYDIKSLLVEEGDFNIILHENGTTNLENALSIPSKTEATSSQNSTIHLKTIQLKNLNIHAINEATNTSIENYIHSAKGGFKQEDDLISGHIDSEFELNVVTNSDTTFIKKKHFTLATDIGFNKDDGILDIQPSEILMENGNFEVEGTVNTHENLNFDLSIKGTKPNFDMLIAFAPPDLISVLENYRNAGEIYFNASIKGPAGNGKTPLIDANFGAGKAYLENTNRGKKIDNMGFNGHFTNGQNRDLTTMEFSLNNMTASLDKGTFKGSVSVKNFESPEIDMQIESNFNLNFMAEFFELEQVQNASGEVSLKMNFHDIVDFNHPEKALEKLNQAYFAEFKVNDLSFNSKELPVPLDDLDVDLVMNGKKAILNTFNLKMGKSDLSIIGYLSNLPAIVHQTNIPVFIHLDISSKYLDIAELTKFSVKDSVSNGIDEQLKNLSLGLTLKSSAKELTASRYLPKGEFFIDSLNVELKHYPHKLSNFFADIRIDDKDLNIKDFTGQLDQSDFHIGGLIHDYSFWMKPELNGDVDLDISLNSDTLRLEDLLSYKGENYLPEEYRHEEFNNLALHFTSGMHYKDSTLHSIDLNLDKLSAKMNLHPLRLTNFRGNIHYEDEHLGVKAFHGEIGKTNFNFDLEYYLGEDPGIRKRDNYIALTADYIDYDALFNFNLNAPQPKENQTPTTADVKVHAEAFNIYELPFTNMRLKATIGHFIYHRLDLQNITADFRTTPDHYLYIDTLDMDAAGGKIKLKGYFNGSNSEQIYFQPDLVMENIDVDKLLFKFENFGQDHIVSDNLQGRLSTRIKGKIRVYPDLVPDLDQSNLEMDVKVLNGRLKNYNPMLALSDYMGDKNLENIRFDTLQNRLDINKGKIIIPNMTIESTLGHMEFSGSHDSDNNIDYYMRIPWKTVKKAAWDKLTGGKKEDTSTDNQDDDIVEVDPNKNIKYLNLNVKGTVDDYKISLKKKKKK